MRHLRNFGIVALLALGVWALPGGGTAADLFGAALFVVITLGIGLLSGRFYLEHRSEISSLGDRWRALLYAAIAVVIVTLAATPKLFSSGPGTVLWIALLAAAGYAVFRVFRHAREY